MKSLDALNILGIANAVNLTEKEAKKAFHLACLKYHPDRNPAGGEMMKMILQAWAVLQEKGFPFQCEDVKEADFYDYGAEINAALNKIVGIPGIEIEVCGSWVWVGKTRYDQKEVFCPHRKFDPKTKEVISDDEIRFRWSRDKKLWYFRPRSERCRKYGKKTLSMKEIKEKFGATKIKGRDVIRLSA